MDNNIKARGKIIVFEGVAKSGIATQIMLLKKYLEENGNETVVFKFPDKTAETSKYVIDYLENSKTFDSRIVHLLFGLNRWEKKNDMEEAVNAGKIVLINRYIYSGTAYSMIKGLDKEWCQIMDTGLPVPDIVFYFDIDMETLQKRPGFGSKQWENSQFQNKLIQMYSQLDNKWIKINGNKSIKDVHQKIIKHFPRTIG